MHKKRFAKSIAGSEATKQSVISNHLHVLSGLLPAARNDLILTFCELVINEELAKSYGIVRQKPKFRADFNRH